MRETCLRCRRPTSACYCAHLTSIPTETRLVLLQHPRERDMAIGTAHMASLCLPNSELHVGLDWDRSPELARALATPGRTPILLYPGSEARDIVREPPTGPVTLVVVDGTWAQAKKLVRTSEVLRALPRYAFSPAQPSEYRIRREPTAESVATIEALAHALGALEGDRFAPLLEPFRKMIDFQIECERAHRDRPTRHAKFRSRVRRMRVPRILTERAADLLFVAAEANSWPYTMRGDPSLRDELVLWAAHRPRTGETFAMIVKPTATIAPGTTRHTGIAEDAIARGASLAELHRAWRGFVRAEDVVCSWGHYEANLFVKSGGFLPEARLDLRHVARDVARGRVGTLGETALRSGAEPAPPIAGVVGRAGRKLAGIADIVGAWSEIAARAGLTTRLDDLESGPPDPSAAAHPATAAPLAHLRT